jgi:hypothetical protein
MYRLIPFLFIASLIAQTPQEVQKQLDQATDKLNKATAMFNPWYTGPLITPAAAMMPLGSGNIQPYLIMQGAYATFNKDRKSIPIKHNIYSLKVSMLTFTGVTNSVDFNLTTTAGVNWQNHQTGGGYSDTTGILGFRICHETLYIPHAKFTIGETFPTGKYKNLSTNGLGLNSTGEGSYQTQFGIAASKIIWWTYPYPFKTRIFIGYTVATPVHVSGFNNYGGGFHARGVVKPGNTLTTDFGLELSLTQRWVFATDIVYVAQNKTKFHGYPGVLANGLPAAVGGGYNDNLSIAPAIEYNWNENLGILWGVQFAVYGRNSQNFTNGEFSVTYTW